MASPRYPSLYQVNTRVWLTETALKLGRPATLGHFSDHQIDHWAEMGLDWIWLLSVWQTGPAGQFVSRSNADWHKEFQETPVVGRTHGQFPPAFSQEIEVM